MDGRSFDALTRRASLLALGGAGMALATQPFEAAGKKKRKKKKKGDVNKLCKQQVAPCITFLGATCTDAECRAVELCCPELGTCDFAGLFDCIQANVESAQTPAAPRLLHP